MITIEEYRQRRTRLNKEIAKNGLDAYYSSCFLPIIRVEFATAARAVPISANTASHMVAIPYAPNSMKMPLTVNASMIFCHTIRRVCLAIATASVIFMGESSIKTISAVSTAASLPSAPMATPTSARASTGASLIPSPTKGVLINAVASRADPVLDSFQRGI